VFSTAHVSPAPHFSSGVPCSTVMPFMSDQSQSGKTLSSEPGGATYSAPASLTL